jgi:hypothetical protein
MMQFMLIIYILITDRILRTSDPFKVAYPTKLTPSSLRAFLAECPGIELLEEDTCGRYPQAMAQAQIFPIKDRQDAVKAVLDAWFSRGRQLAVKNKDRLPHVVFPASPGIFFTLHFKCSIFYCY